jgi:glutamyl-tRNA reductase
VISEATVLSTCNRFEVYFAAQDSYAAFHDAMRYLEKHSGLPQSVLRRNLFLLSGEDAIWHLLRVSSGLDSLVVGEGQILSQVKQCYNHGIEEDGSAGKVVSRMLNSAVAAGKRVRTETGASPLRETPCHVIIADHARGLTFVCVGCWCCSCRD